MYLQPNEANEIIKALQCEYKHEFGGVMIYEATFSQNNQIHGQSYAVSPLPEVFLSISVVVLAWILAACDYQFAWVFGSPRVLLFSGIA